ncbi:MAG: hypothetical protein EP341_07830, partial [Sphingomonadales bacterium]
MTGRRWKSASAIAAVLVLAGCARIVPPVLPPADNALAAGIRSGPAIAALGFSETDAAAALAGFRESCPQLTTRDDQSGLASSQDWRVPCDVAAAWDTGSAREFFSANFAAVQVGDGSAFATGYFEPEIAGCRTRQPGCETPVYSMPPDLVRAWPDDVPESEREGRAPLGRYDASGAFIPYYERAEIEQGALAGRGLEIAYAADPIEFFFLQIQGSGRLKTPDGEVIRIGYAGQNGREYVGIGGVMRRHGLLGDGPGQYGASMQGIMQYLRENPVEGAELMRLNKSWIFFRVLEGDGPLGA